MKTAVKNDDNSQRRAVEEALEACGGNQSQAANRLKISLSVLRNRIRHLNPQAPINHRVGRPKVVK
jgi:DNA-binding NtrC family response regulator